MIRWFKHLSVRRKFLLCLAPGMLTLVWDAFIAHWKFNTGTMKLTQAIPVAFGFFAFAVLMFAAVAPMKTVARDTLTKLTGIIGMAVGAGGIYFHATSLIESLHGEEMTWKNVGNLIKQAPPLFAPAAFAGIGVLLLLLNRIIPESHGGHTGHTGRHSQPHLQTHP